MPSEIRIRVAGHYCKDPAARWLQSVERRVATMEWQDFCSLLLDRFGRDEHDVLIRQLLHIRQTSTVAEYITPKFGCSLRPCLVVASTSSTKILTNN